MSQVLLDAYRKKLLERRLYGELWNRKMAVMITRKRKIGNIAICITLLAKKIWFFNSVYTPIRKQAPCTVVILWRKSDRIFVGSPLFLKQANREKILSHCLFVNSAFNSYYYKKQVKQAVLKKHGFINRLWAKIPPSYNLAPEISSNVLAN
jgi:hypothetical protein